MKLKYKDSNYLLLLIITVICGNIFSAILVPGIDLISLHIFSNNSFYNYATIGSLAISIPPACAVISGFIVNNIIYKRLIRIAGIILLILNTIMYLEASNIIVYIILTIIYGIFLNALYCSVDRQIVILISKNISNFQSDIMILSSLLSVINYKISGYIFTIFNLRGLVVYSSIFTLILFLCLNLIPAIDKISLTKLNNHQLNLPKFSDLIKIFAKHKNLLVFWIVILGIVIGLCGINLLITTKIRYEKWPFSIWSSIMAIISLGILIGAIIYKLKFIQNIHPIKTISFTAIFIGLYLIIFNKLGNIESLLISVWIMGIATALFNVNINTIFFKYISKNNDLIIISPIINGLIMSTFNIIYIIGPIIINKLLHLNLSYKLISIGSGIICLIFATLLINLKILLI